MLQTYDRRVTAQLQL